jgi:hypothetical protein
LALPFGTVEIHSGHSLIHTGRAKLVHLVCFVYLVSLVQPNKPKRPHKQNNKPVLASLAQILDHLREASSRGGGFFITDLVVDYPAGDWGTEECLLARDELGFYSV